MKQTCQNKQANKTEPESDSSDNRKQRTDELDKQTLEDTVRETDRLWNPLLDKQPVSQIGCRGEQEREGEAKDLKRLKECRGFKICAQIL